MTEDLIQEPVAHGDLYLRFPDRETADDVLQDYTGAIDIIGHIAVPSGDKAKDADGNVIDVMTFVEGWHVNIRGPMPLGLQVYAVEVTNPVRVWA